MFDGRTKAPITRRTVTKEIVSTHVRCALCGSAFDVAAWSALELLETLGPNVIVRHALAWPASATIEIRRCRCGRSIARKSRATGEDRPSKDPAAFRR